MSEADETHRAVFQCFTLSINYAFVTLIPSSSRTTFIPERSYSANSVFNPSQISADLRFNAHLFLHHITEGKDQHQYSGTALVLFIACGLYGLEVGRLPVQAHDILVGNPSATNMTNKGAVSVAFDTHTFPTHTHTPASAYNITRITIPSDL